MGMGVFGSLAWGQRRSWTGATTDCICGRVFWLRLSPSPAPGGRGLPRGRVVTSLVRLGCGDGHRPPLQTESICGRVFRMRLSPSPAPGGRGLPGGRVVISLVRFGSGDGHRPPLQLILFADAFLGCGYHRAPRPEVAGYLITPCRRDSRCSRGRCRRRRWSGRRG
jgi:hypothetical protein